jgi:putative NADH-flavin reductase
MNRNVLVFGATGKTGSHICKVLESKTISYSVFVREGSQDKLANKSVNIQYGDVLNAQDVKNAFKDSVFTDVIIALGSKELKSTDIRSRGTKHIIDAMGASQSEARIHVISALGIGDSWNQLVWHAKLISNLLIKSSMIDHGKQEEYVKNSSFSYHILRPVGLKDGQATGNVKVQNEGFPSSSSIQRADVANFLVDGLLENKTGISAICQG